MSVVPVAGLGPYLGQMPLYTSLIPKRSLPGKESGNRDFSVKAIPKAPPLLNNAIQPNHLRKVLGKGNFNSVIMPRTEPVPETDSMYPKQGIARHEKKGLAYNVIPGKRLNVPILPIADSTFAYRNNKLGQSK